MKNSRPVFTGRARPLSDLEHLLMVRSGYAIAEYALISEGDRVLVGVSGGIKSFALLHVLELHRRRFSFAFELLPVLVASDQDPSVASAIVRYWAEAGITIKVLTGTGQWRQRLAQYGRDQACHKLALAQVLEDFLETLLANIFFSGQLKSIPVRSPTQVDQITTVHPLVNIERDLVEQFARERHFTSLAGSGPEGDDADGAGRLQAQAMLTAMEQRYPKVKRSLLAAMKHIRASHVLDTRLNPSQPLPGK